MLKENKGFKKRLALYNDKKCFEGFFPLKQLFGFLYSYNKITYLLSIDLALNRNANNDKSIFFGKEKVGVTSKARLVLKDLELWVPQLRLNPSLEVSVIDPTGISRTAVILFKNNTSILSNDFICSITLTSNEGFNLS